MDNNSLRTDPIELINENGSSAYMQHPENPLFKNHPTCDQAGYKCIYCSQCPLGDQFVVPEDEKDVYEEYIKSCLEYHKIHNPEIHDILTRGDPCG